MRATESRILIPGLLRMQRAGRLRAIIPPFLRARLLRLASESLEKASDGHLVDDWTRPLLPLAGGTSSASHAAVVALPYDKAKARLRGTAKVRASRDIGRPRCLLVTSKFDAGGMDEMVAFLARGLRSQGFETAVLHTPLTAELARGRLARVVSSAGIEVAVLAEREGRKWLRDWRPDIISAHGALTWVLEEATSLSAPYVDVLHGMQSLFEADEPGRAERNRHVAAVVAVSELVRQQYVRTASFSPDRVTVIPNGVDAERRSRIDRSAARASLGLRDEFLFVSLARHCLVKNPFGLVSAFEEVAAAHPDAHLLVAGRADDAVYCRQVRRLRDGLSARNRVHLRDHATNPALVLSAADGFVLNSFSEGWALASMEALHAGVPVIASDVGGAREQLGKDGKRGYLVANPLGDPLDVTWGRMRSVCYSRQVNRDELVSAMCALVEDRARWEARREELAYESSERFHPDRCLREHATLLHALAGRKGPQEHTESLRAAAS